MKQQNILVVLVLIGNLTSLAAFVCAAEQATVQAVNPAQQQEQIYGRELMSQQERIDYRARMLRAKSAEEQKQIRQEHHERMQERAKLQGVELPGEPPLRGGGRGRMGGGSGGGSVGRGYGGGRNR